MLMQCWDDGVTSDIRLTELLRRHGAKASFNLNAGLHGAQRQPGWSYLGTEVRRLARPELAAVYEGFTIANHSLTHPHLEALPAAAARQEIGDGRARLQDWFGQPVRGFAWPFGTHDAVTERLVREAGHLYARTTDVADGPIPQADAMALAPSCRVLAPDFWQRVEHARRHGVFYFWGHSYELVDEARWAALDATLARLGRLPGARWCEVAELFDAPAAAGPRG